MPASALPVVLVTGGSAGLGKEIARAFGKTQKQVVIVARDETRLQAAVAELQGEQINATGFIADVTQQADVERLHAQVTAQFGRLDLLINNAGRSTRGQIADTTPEAFQELWEANFLSAVRCTRAFLPMLLANQGGVVFIGSLASKVASPYLGAYPASKFPLAAYAQQLRLELAAAGLHVLLVCPGPLQRDDAGQRYATAAANLPTAAHKPGGGVKLKGIPPVYLAEQIVRACDRRQLELVVPFKAKLLFAIAALSARWGDWLIRRNIG
jgi:short-subunit dehydrogenase